MRHVAVVLALALLASAPGCVTKKIKKALEEETRASFTISGDAQVLATVEKQLSLLYKVGVHLETLEKGVQILRIIGAYQEVVNAITWLIARNLMLLANDEVTRSLLSVAIAALK